MLDISIIIPTYNRSTILKKTLESFQNLIINKHVSWELIVIDNNSDDGTKRVVTKYINELPIKYLFEGLQGKNHALNTALQNVEGETIVFVDDDVSVDKNWLAEIYNSVKKYPDYKIFGGKIIPEFPTGTNKWKKNSEYSDYVYAIHDPNQVEGLYSNGRTPGGPNCWVNRSVFDSGYRYDTKIGPKGYGRISGSELEFFTRLFQKGFQPVYIPSACVSHRIQKFQTKIKYLIKRCYASGRGYVYINGFENCKKIHGIPRYLFRQILENLFCAGFSLLKFNTKAFFEHGLKVAHLLGCIKQHQVENKKH